MDAAGARALAQRISEGKPPEDRLEPTRRQTLEPMRVGDGVVYIRPSTLRAARDVWIYVRGADGRLRRAR